MFSILMGVLYGDVLKDWKKLRSSVLLEIQQTAASWDERKWWEELSRSVPLPCTWASWTEDKLQLKWEEEQDRMWKCIPTPEDHPFFVCFRAGLQAFLIIALGFNNSWVVLKIHLERTLHMFVSHSNLKYKVFYFSSLLLYCANCT